MYFSYFLYALPKNFLQVKNSNNKNVRKNTNGLEIEGKPLCARVFFERKLLLSMKAPICGCKFSPLRSWDDFAPTRQLTP